MEIIYSKESEELKRKIEEREFEREFDALSDHLVPEEDRTYNRKYKNLKIVYRGQ